MKNVQNLTAVSERIIRHSDNSKYNSILYLCNFVCEGIKIM